MCCRLQMQMGSITQMLVSKCDTFIICNHINFIEITTALRLDMSRVDIGTVMTFGPFM